MKIAALIVALLAGCASLGADLGQARESWQGARYEEVLAQWGAPARSAKLADGRESHTWISEDTVATGYLYPSIAIFGGSGGVAIGGGVTVSPGAGEVVRCERTFSFRDGRVTEQTWLGPARYCRTFRRKSLS